MYHAGRGLTRARRYRNALIRLSHHCFAQGQSLAHTVFTHEIPCSRKTLYNYIDQVFLLLKTSIYAARYVLKCKPRKLVQGSAWLQKNSVGRTHENFQNSFRKILIFQLSNLDTVEGGWDNSTQVFLTIFFRNCSLYAYFCAAREITGPGSESF